MTHRLASSLSAGDPGAVPTLHPVMTDATSPITTTDTVTVQQNPTPTINLPNVHHLVDHAVDTKIPPVHRLHHGSGATATMTVPQLSTTVAATVPVPQLNTTVAATILVPQIETTAAATVPIPHPETIVNAATLEAVTVDTTHAMTLPVLHTHVLMSFTVTIIPHPRTTTHQTPVITMALATHIMCGAIPHHPRGLQNPRPAENITIRHHTHITFLRRRTTTTHTPCHTTTPMATMPLRTPLSINKLPNRLPPPPPILLLLMRHPLALSLIHI